MKTLLLFITLTLAACAKPASTPSTLAGSWVDVENYRAEFKADGAVRIEACGITGSYTEPVDGVMTLMVSASSQCLEVGVHQCEIQVYSKDEIGIACGLLNTRFMRE